MSSTPSDTDRLASSLHRSVLGALLAVFAILGAGLAIRSVPAGDVGLGLLGVVVALGAGYWVVSLFADGLRER